MAGACHFNEEIPTIKYEYLDHTADVQLHSWGDNLKEAFEQVATAMFGYMTTDYNTVEMTDVQQIEAEERFINCQNGSLLQTEPSLNQPNVHILCMISLEKFHSIHTISGGEDMEQLLFHFLDEWLFMFCAEPFFIPRKIVITEFDKENFKIKSKGYGEEFVIGKHPQGTEVKAITYSNMQIHQDLNEVFVIIDI